MYAFLAKQDQVNTTSLGRVFTSASFKTDQRSCLSHSYLSKIHTPVQETLTSSTLPPKGVGGGGEFGTAI